MDITLALGAELLLSAGLESDAAAARARLAATLSSGRAAEHFARMVRALGGPTDFLSHYGTQLAAAPIIRPVHAAERGFVASIRTRELGLAVIELGGGRRVASDAIDHRVGLSRLLGKGAEAGDAPLCLVHAADEDGFQRAAEIVKSAYVLGERGESATVLARIAG